MTALNDNKISEDARRYAEYFADYLRARASSGYLANTEYFRVPGSDRSASALKNSNRLALSHEKATLVLEEVKGIVPKDRLSLECQWEYGEKKCNIAFKVRK